MASMRTLLIGIVALLAIAFTSCISDGFTTSQNARLTFSRDTVSFDTLFTGVGSPTARLVVRNRNKQGVRISSIRFKRDDSEFRLNVDGQSGTVFSDVEIRGRDSIYVFIECRIPESQGDEPYLVEDQLEFVTNGNRQEVQVEAYGQNVTRLEALTLERDMDMTAERPYVVFDSLVVAAGATLRCAPGSRLLFHDKARLVVRGTIDAAGEPGKPVQLRGDRLDQVLPGVSYDILAGQWDGMVIAPESFGNRLEYVDMRSTRYGVRVDSCGVTDRQKLLIRNSWLHNSQGNVLSSAYARVDAYGVCFSEAAGAVVSLTGGEHEFIQCTIANNYLFSAISAPLLCMYHCLPPDPDKGGKPLSDLPLMRMRLCNSIIYGLAGDVNEGDLSGSDVTFHNVLMKSTGSNDEHFIDCVWDADPMFLTRRSDYYFNYHVEPGSPAIGAGNPAFVSAATLTDMDGCDRLSDGAPTLGAYARPEAPAGTPPPTLSRRH